MSGWAIAGIVGGVAVAGGLAWWAISSSKKSAPTVAQQHPPQATGTAGTVSQWLGVGTQAAGFVDTTAHAAGDVGDLFN